MNIVDEKGTRHKYSSLGSDKAAAAFKNHKVRVFQKIKLNKQQRAAAQTGTKEKKAPADDAKDKPTMTMSDILAKFIAK